MEKEIPKYFEKQLNYQIGGGDSTEMCLVTDVKNERTFIRVEKTYTKRYELKDIEIAYRTFKGLTDGHGFGKKIYELEELSKEKYVHVSELNHEQNN